MWKPETEADDGEAQPASPEEPVTTGQLRALRYELFGEMGRARNAAYEVEGRLNAKLWRLILMAVVAVYAAVIGFVIGSRAKSR